MAFASIDAFKPTGVLHIGGVPICYNNEFTIGGMPFGHSYVPVVQVADGTFQLAKVVVEEPLEEVMEVSKIVEDPMEVDVIKEEEWSIVPHKRARSSPTLSPQQPRRFNRRSPSKKMVVKKVYAPISQSARTMKKVQRAYKNELETRPNLPVSNPFASLRLVRKNSPVAILKTMEEFPQEYQVQFRGRSPQNRQSVKERLTFPRVSARDRLGPKDQKKGSSSVRQRLGQRIKPVKERLGPKKMWVPKERAQPMEIGQEPRNKRRHVARKEGQVVVHAQVHMVEISEEREMHDFVNMASDGEIPFTKKDSKDKQDRASSSHILHGERPTEDEGEDLNGKDRWHEGEKPKLMSIIEKNERKIAAMMDEREKERKIFKKMHKFLERKKLLEDLEKEGSSSEEEDEYKGKVLKERRSKSRYEYSDEEGEKPKRRHSKERRNKHKYGSSEEDEEKGYRKYPKGRRNKARYESSEEEMPERRHRTGARRSDSTKQVIQEMINLQLQATGAGRFANLRKRCGRPYPKEYEHIPYPLGYQVPKFNLFDGTGKESITPDQHLIQFRNACGNTAHDEALLLKQFSQSLTGAAFEWYSSLENDSVDTWEEMEDLFRAKFAMVNQRLLVADVACEKPKPGEAPLDYINRWRNMHIRCSHQMSEREAVEFLIRNLDDWIKRPLSGSDIYTYEDLVTRVARIVHIGPPKETPSFSRDTKKQSTRAH